MQTLKVLVTASTFPRWEHDTAPRFILDLCKSLTTQGDVTCLVLVPHSHGAQTTDVIEGIRIKRYRYIVPSALELISGLGIVAKLKKHPVLIGLVPLFLFFQLGATLLTIWRYQPDVLLVNWIIPQGFIAAIIKLLTPKLKMVLLAHGADLGLVETHQGLRKLGRCILRKMDTVVAICTRFQQKLAALGDLEARAIPVIPLGIDVAAFAQYSPDHVSHNSPPKYLLFIGRLEEKKGLEYLLRAIPKIVEWHPDVLLRIIGDGTLKTQLEDLTKQLQIEAYVIFLGAVPHPELPQYFAEAYIFVAPSIDTGADFEAIPRTILEAAACHVPIIATDAGGIGDFIEHGITGMLIAQRNADALAENIQILLECDDLRGTLARKAYQKLIQEFDFALSGRKLRREIFRVFSSLKR